MMNEKYQYDSDRFDFFRNELRTANYFSVISSMNEFKGINSPVDLYKIPSDVKVVKTEKTYDNMKIDKSLLNWALKQAYGNNGNN